MGYQFGKAMDEGIFGSAEERYGEAPPKSAFGEWWFGGNEQINPYTSSAFEAMTNAYNQMMSPNNPWMQSIPQVSATGSLRNMGLFNDSLQSAEQAYQQTLNAAQNFDPTQWSQNFANLAPQIGQLVQGNFAPLQQGLMTTAKQQTEQDIQGIMQNMPGMANSSAFAGAAGQASAQRYGDVMNQMNQMNAQLTGNLWGQAMPLTYDAANKSFQNMLAASGLGMQSAGLGLDAWLGQNQLARDYSQMDLQAQMANQGAYTDLGTASLGFGTNIMNTIGQYGTPMMQYQPGFGERLWDKATDIIPLLGGGDGGFNLNFGGGGGGGGYATVPGWGPAQVTQKDWGWEYDFF